MTEFAYPPNVDYQSDRLIKIGAAGLVLAFVRRQPGLEGIQLVDCVFWADRYGPAGGPLRHRVVVRFLDRSKPDGDGIATAHDVAVSVSSASNSLYTPDIVLSDLQLAMVALLARR